MEILYKYVAPNAIFNSGGRVDIAKCHPGTRTDVLRLIEEWMLRPFDDSPDKIFWLSGPAGAGKTSIVHTIAERCQERELPLTNFFFFRTDSSRCDTSSFVPTLLYQIIQIYPEMRSSLVTILSSNPFILNAGVDSQLSQLLLTPLRAIQRSSSSFRPIIMLIDGLDECDPMNKLGQRQILHTLDNALIKDGHLFRVLVASRVEHQLTLAFNQMSTAVLPLYLDNEYSPESDIRLCVAEKFEEIKNYHPLADTCDRIWPSTTNFDSIVKKSSRQFIYAATVMRYILDSPANPQLSLQRVLGITPLATRSPFSHLDAMYTYILSQTDDQDALKDILHAQLLRAAIHREASIQQILLMYNPLYTEAFLHSCVADLSSIAHLGCRELTFHHASLSDYLQDQSRSGVYFVDIDAFNIKALPKIWVHVGQVKEGGYTSSHTEKQGLAS